MADVHSPTSEGSIDINSVPTAGVPTVGEPLLQKQEYDALDADVGQTEPVEGVGETEAVNKLEEDFLAGDRMDDTEVVNRAVGAEAGPYLGLEGCPKLWMGAHLNKACELKANRWLKIGRSPKAHVLLNNAGVSREHCCLRWDKYRRLVELRDESTSGTLVNGEAMSRGAKIALAHGDSVAIHGKDTKFEFLLDLRPVRLAITDPHQVSRQRKEGKKGQGPTTLAKRRAILQSQLRHLQQELEAAEKKAFETETTYFDTVARRNIRVKEDREREEQHEKLIQSTKDLEVQLKESRKEWLRKLEAEYKKNEEGVKGIIDEATALQERVEKLQLKKDEIERSIHPERYAVADVSRVTSVSIEKPTPQVDDADGENTWDGEPEAKRLRVTDE